MLEHGANLFECDTWKPVDELVYSGAIFKVLEQCSNRYARAREHPSITHASRIALHDRT